MPPYARWGQPGDCSSSWQIYECSSTLGGTREQSLNKQHFCLNFAPRHLRICLQTLTCSTLLSDSLLLEAGPEETQKQIRWVITVSFMGLLLMLQKNNCSSQHKIMRRVCAACCFLLLTAPDTQCLHRTAKHDGKSHSL